VLLVSCGSSCYSFTRVVALDKLNGGSEKLTIIIPMIAAVSFGIYRVVFL